MRSFVSNSAGMTLKRWLLPPPDEPEAVLNVCVCFPGVSWDALSKVKQRHSDMSLTFAKFVQWGKVCCSSQRAIFLPFNHNPIAPLAHQKSFSHSKRFFLFQVNTDLLLPMQMHWDAFWFATGFTASLT